MLVPRPKHLALLALIALPITSCDRLSPSKATAEAQEDQSHLPENEEIMNFRTKTRQLYNNREFDKLEALAERLQKNKERFRSGAWKILHFHQCMDCAETEPESMRKLHDEIHQEWVKKYPKSQTASIAHARFFLDYAWHARTAEYADKVTEEGWRLFRERLGKASEILEQAKGQEGNCPMLWLSFQRLALGQGWEMEKYDALYEQAMKSEPGFDEHHVARAYHLLPRWHGEEGQWEADAKEQAAKMGELGPQIFARVVTRTSRYYDNVFAECNVSWPEVKAGYEDLLKAFPDSAQNLHSYCRTACFANDRALAKELFIRIGDGKSPESWKKGEFERAKKWAMEAP